MIKWFYYWDEWRKAYWGLIGKYPELFAFLHRMYVFQHQQGSGRLDSSDALFRTRAGARPSKVRRMLKRKLAGRAGAESTACVGGGAAPTEEVVARVDVLFYTHSNRDTCLGVGEKLFAKIREKQLDITGAFYQNGRHKILDVELHHEIPVITLDVTPTLKGVVRFCQMLPIVYGYGMKSSAVFKYICRHPFVTMINLLKNTTTSVCIDRMLDRIKPKVLLSCNEQGGGDNSILFALARKKGIYSIQYMHAVPTKQFVPFICDEYWSWSELTTRMLLGDEQDARVTDMGSMEHENRETVIGYGIRRPEEERRVLLLAQMGMDEAWGIRAIAEGMQTFCDGIHLYKTPLKVRIREHPYAGVKERKQLEHFMTGISYETTTKATPLAQDVEWATHVYTICSNAIFAALLGGKPAYLVWNEELNEIYGRAFLPDANIIASSIEFVDSLDRETPPNLSEEILQQVLGAPGAMDRAVERIEELVS